MKISDERLSEIRHNGLMGGDPEFCLPTTQTEMMYVAAELQQLRDERRWRPIGKRRMLPTPFQVTDGKETAAFDFFEYQKSVDISRIGMDVTHYRPLPMDLPEVE